MDNARPTVGGIDRDRIERDRIDRDRDRIDRDRIDRITQCVCGKLTDATAALDAGNPGKAGVLLREGYYLLDIAADLAGEPAEPENPREAPMSARSYEHIFEQVRRWERGEELPSRADRRLIARTMDIHEEELFGVGDDPA